MPVMESSCCCYNLLDAMLQPTCHLQLPYCCHVALHNCHNTSHDGICWHHLLFCLKPLLCASVCYKLDAWLQVRLRFFSSVHVDTFMALLAKPAYSDHEQELQNALLSFCNTFHKSCLPAASSCAQTAEMQMKS